MTIHDDHMYHGAALIQIAEHPSFTAINSLRTAAGIFHNAYRINQDIAVYFKYATKPTQAFDEYQRYCRKLCSRELKKGGVSC